MKILGKRSDIQSNPCYLTCLILFIDIFEQIKDSKTMFDLFQRILKNDYDGKSMIQRQIFLQILIYLSSTKKGLTLDELRTLLTEYDKFDANLVNEAIDEFTERYDFAYTFSPETDQLMS